MRRRLLALALVFLPVQGSAAALVSGAQTGHSHCSGQVCRCGSGAARATHCPPKKAAAPSCHETVDPLGALMQAAGCHGGQDEASAPVSSRPQVAPEPFDAGPAFRSFDLAAARATGALPGFLQIDLPPPRIA